MTEEEKELASMEEALEFAYRRDCDFWEEWE